MKILNYLSKLVGTLFKDLNFHKSNEEGLKSTTLLFKMAFSRMILEYFSVSLQEVCPNGW